ncbi:hypothetical protein A4X13_0g558 [Tilletia indica]|uniref:Uncharacterized protein n=1 Tax=Tilletia indica TaxID=43049 RepID=A0A177TNE8_9BASI|nr:hypothetical protein A4X13_0g558 [Tilletia indica]
MSGIQEPQGLGPETPGPHASGVAEVTNQQLMAMLQSMQTAFRHSDSRFEDLTSRLAKLEQGISKTAVPAALNSTADVITPRPGAPFTTPVLNPGQQAGPFARPGDTPVTTRARGVSGFFVPMTPARTVQSKSGYAPATPHKATQGPDVTDRTVGTRTRVDAARASLSEASPEVKAAKQGLWVDCYEVARSKAPEGTDEEHAEAADRLCSERWLELRGQHVRSLLLKDGSGSSTSSPKESGKASEPTRRISQTASAKITKLTYSNFFEWTSEIFALLAPIPYAGEILEGIQHGLDYDPLQPTKVTENYDHTLDLEMGSLVGGSVGPDTRGIIFTQQAAGEYRGSFLFRALAHALQRKDELAQTINIQQVLATKQDPGESVRSFGDKLRTLFLKASAMGHPFTSALQVCFLLQGVSQHLKAACLSIKGFQTQGVQYSFDDALQFLISSELSATSSINEYQGLSLLSRPTAMHVTGTDSNGQPRRFHVLSNTTDPKAPNFFRGECRYCKRWGHREQDCSTKKMAIDNANLQDTDVKQYNAEKEKSVAAANIAMGTFGDVDSRSDAEGEIYEIVDAETGERMFGRLTTSSIDED